MCVVCQGAIAAASVLASILPSVVQPESNIENIRPDRRSQQTFTVPDIAGTRCQKVGALRTAKTVKFQCVKSAKGMRWVKASKAIAPIDTTTTSTSTTTSTTVPLYSDPDITDVKYLLNLQECRIRDATSMPSSINSSGFPRSSSLRSGFGQLEVLVIPVNFTDLAFSASDAKAMETAYTKVNTFFSAMSYGRAAVKMTLAPSSSWVDIGGTVDQNGLINKPPQWDGSNFYRKVIEIYLRNNTISGYDVVEVATAYSTRFWGGQAMQAGDGIYGTGKSFAGIQHFGSATQRWDIAAHELGHAWLGFEDLYLFKGGFPLGIWDTMSNSGTEFSGWSRFLAGWIEPNWVRCANPRTPTRHYLSPLNADKSDDKPRMLVLPLTSQSAIIAELRTPTVWQTAVKSPTLVVYRVDTGIDHGNGPISLVGTTDQPGGTLTSDGVKITIKGINTSGVTIDISTG
jgi:M6 family metalloprotease-like protein